MTSTKTITSTGGWESFETIEVPNILLSAGKHVLKFYIDSGVEFNIASIKFSKTGETDQSTFTALNGHTKSMNKVNVAVNQSIDLATVPSSISNFTLLVNGNETPISSVVTNSTKNRTIEITTSEILIYTDVIKVSYNGTLIKSQSGKTLETFSNLTIRNTLTPLFVLPRKIEAEDFVTMVGLGIEDTTDDGGGKNLGYTDANDYTDYIVYSETNAPYQVNFRLAAQNNTGQIGLYLVDSNGSETELAKINTPVTGGWQTWATVSSNVIIPSGIHTLRMKVLTGGFNLNWMEFILLDDNGDADGDGILDEEDNCPNTVAGATVDVHGCEVFTLPTDNFKIEVKGETCPGKKNGKIIITPTLTHNYQLRINGVVRSFTAGITLSGLTSNTYNLCITVVGQEFMQCFELVIDEGITVSGRAHLSSNKATVQIEKGTAPFKVFVNGDLLFEALSNTIDVNVKHGDLLEVKSAIDCEGVITKKIELFDSIVAYPNPSRGHFEIIIPEMEKPVKMEVFNGMGQLIETIDYQNHFGKLKVDLSDKPKGMYLAKVYLNNLKVLKLIKQ